MSFAEKLDQIFITVQHWVAGFFPAWLQPFVMIVLGVVAIVAAFPGIFAVTTVLERKGLGRMQNRLGPKSRWAAWHFAADGGRYQVADQGRHCFL